MYLYGGTDGIAGLEPNIYPPTGNRISIGVFDILRIADGMVVEHWGLMDNMAMMQQLGVMSAPSEG